MKKKAIAALPTRTKSGGNFGLGSKKDDGTGPENLAISVGRAETVLRLYAHETGLDFDNEDERRFAVVDLLTDLRLFVDGEGKNMEWDGIIGTTMMHANEEKMSGEFRECEPECDGIREDSDPGFTPDPPVPHGYVIVERCDSCNRYDNDLDAARVWGDDAKWHGTGRAKVAIARKRNLGWV